MSSPDFGSRRRLLGFAALGLSAALGGCFQPMYGGATRAVTGESVRDALAAVDVAPIPERIGHYLRNDLAFELDGSGTESVKRYLLKISVKESLGVTVTDYSTGIANSATLEATADYTLTEIGKDKPLASGTAVARAAYDRSQQRFANLRAARDAQIRAARQLAELIRNRLAAGFAGGF